jgi:hypothetical protein
MVISTAVVQLVTLILAALALIMGAYLLIIGKRPWRGEEPEKVAPRIRLLGLSYILVFGSAMVQIIVQPKDLLDSEILGGLMVLGGVIVIIVVLLESRASRRGSRT